MNALIFRPVKIGCLWGIDLFAHWSIWFLPLFVAVRALVLYSVEDAWLQVALVGGVYACLIIHELAHIAIAKTLAIRIRDVTLYPLGGIARPAIISERPWQEIWIAAAGPFAHLAIASIIAGILVFGGMPPEPQIPPSASFLAVFLNRLLWLNVLMAILQMTPAFPMDGGRIFRGALALSAQRLRATEVASMLSSFVALLLIIPGMVWMSSVWWLILLGIIIHVAGQQELMSVRYYASLQQPSPAYSAGTAPLVPVDQLLDEDVQPTEPGFTGLIWNRKNRLWIVWRNGQPVSAHALLGE